MPTDIEQAYIDQGYRLPEGLTWPHIGRLRRKWDVAAIFVPIAKSPGGIGWGVPFIDGQPLRHP